MSLSLSFFLQVFHLSNHNHNTCNYIRQCIVSTANTIPPLPAHKIIAGVFKKLGIIEQWGNGLKIISEDLKNYPEIEFKGSEPGIAFRVTFLKKNYEEDITPKTTPKTTRNITDLLEKHVVTTRGELLNLLQNKLGESWEKVGGKLGDNQIEDSSITIEKLSNLIGISTTSIENNIGKLKKLNLIKRSDSARSGHWEVID